MLVSIPEVARVAKPEADGRVVVFRPPGAWPTDNRTRRFITLAERQYSYATDLDILRRSVERMLAQQDERGSFYTDHDYTRGIDKVDDQIGSASMLAYYLSQTESDEKRVEALELAVRFHLDHLVYQPPAGGCRYSRFRLDADSAIDWCNTLWCLWGGALVLRHGTPFLASSTVSRMKDLLEDYWKYVSTYPARDENPCHNQLVAYCHIGNLYAHVVGNRAIAAELSDYYHKRLRRLRIKDRGHWIYSEFNQWDAHYGLVSWTALECLFAETGDRAYAEDADEMALYFNEMVSAGGYIWGGSRQNECGLDEFVHLPASRGAELELSRLLLSEPSNEWRQMAMEGHLGRTLVERMALALPARKVQRRLEPTPWHFMRGEASACLRDDLRPTLVSAAGLEIIPSANALGVESGLVWHSVAGWKKDLLHSQPPRASEGHRYSDSHPIQLQHAAGLTTRHRGYLWETRQWWISNGQSLLWIGHLLTHANISCDQVDFILGAPVLTRLGGQPMSVTEVESAEGMKADTQGDPFAVLTKRFLKFGDIHVGGTSPLKFLRPAKDAFHTFPTSGGRLHRDVGTSNELRLQLSDVQREIPCRDSLFFAVEIGRDVPSLSAHHDPKYWRLETSAGSFSARQHDGIWNYSLKSGAVEEKLPQIGFRFQSNDGPSGTTVPEKELLE